MSYGINGYKFKSNNINDLILFLNEFKNEASNNYNSIIREYLENIFYAHILCKNDRIDFLQELDFVFDDFYEKYKNDSDLNISSITEELIKNTNQEVIKIFFNDKYNFILINNTLGKMYKLFDSFNSDLLEEFSFHTSSGETNLTHELRLKDELYFNKLRKTLNLKDNDDFEDYCNENDIYLKTPSYLNYIETVDVWEDFTEKSYYINKSAYSVVILDESSNFKKCGLNNFNYPEGYLLSSFIDDMLKDIKEDKYSRFYIMSEYKKINQDIIKKPSDYIRWKQNLRSKDSFENEALTFFFNKVEDYKLLYKDVLLSEYINFKLF